MSASAARRQRLRKNSSRCVILYFVPTVTYCTVHRRSVVIRASPESVLRAVPDLLIELISCRKSWRLGGEPD